MTAPSDLPGPRMRVAATRGDDRLTLVCLCGCRTRTPIIVPGHQYRPGGVVHVLELVRPGVVIDRTRR